MIRRAAALILALTLSPAVLRAQDTVLTVDAPSADVYKGPTTVTPVIGHVSRGAVLPISRNLGSWVKISWPDAPDGVGYVHVTMGRIGPPRADASVRKMPSTQSSSTSASSASAGSASAASGPAPVTTTIPMRGRTSVGEQVVSRGQLTGTPASHIFGVGGLVGSTSSVGATARAWRNNRLGIQVGFSRDAMTSSAGAGRVTSMQFEPGVVYALLDHVGDYVWIRPYVGSVASLRHQTLRVTAPIALEPAVDSSVGFRVFGGSELTFAAVPRFGLSADVGYRRFPATFSGFDPDPLSVTIAGHWYIK
jgi:hypothetical protein